MIATEQEARDWIAALPDIEARTVSRLERYEAMLRRENDRQNLVSSRSLDNLWVRHFADSLQLRRDVPRETKDWLDLGTGAGFPGAVVALAYPDLKVVCIESRALRTNYLHAVVDELALENCQIVHNSLQDVESEQFGVISARAFAPLPKLLALSARFSTRDTLWRLPKGRSAAQELDELAGWEHMFHVEQSLTDQDAGIICGRLLGRKRGKRT